MAERIRTRFLVVGSGIAGLHTAWRGSATGDVVVLTKRSLFDSATAYAQGGIAAALGAGDTPELHRQDTLAAGAALFALGVTLAQKPLGKVPYDLPVLVAIKLVVHPLIVYLLLSWIGGFDWVWIASAVLMAALPPAANVYVLAQRYDTYVAKASAGILLGTLASVVTVTIVLALLVDDPAAVALN